MLNLLSERRRLAAAIAVTKEVSRSPIRDRERELGVISEIGNLSSCDRKFLSLLFEMTIQEEIAAIQGGTGGADVSGTEISSLSGDYNSLSYLAGFISSSPGTEIVSGIFNESFFEGAADHGGHIIQENESTGSPSFAISSETGPIIEVKEEGTMLIHWEALKNRHGPERIRAVKS